MPFVKALSFSPMIVGIILGMLYANSLRNNLPDTWVPGIQFCSKRVLRIGMIRRICLPIMNFMKNGGSSLLIRKRKEHSEVTAL